MIIFDKVAKTKNVAAIRQAIEPHPKIVRAAEFLRCILQIVAIALIQQIRL